MQHPLPECIKMKKDVIYSTTGVRLKWYEQTDLDNKEVKQNIQVILPCRPTL